MPSLPVLTRNRALAALLVSLGFGFAGGAGLNGLAGSRLTLPDGAEVPSFEDAPAAVATASASSESSASETPSEAPTPAGPDDYKVDRRVFTDAVVRRNIFDSAATFSDASTTPETMDCKDSKSRLLATVVAEPAEYSSALISDGGKGRANGYRIGDDVGSDGKILTIEQKKVCLDGGGCLCMGDDRPKSAAGDVASATATDDGGGVTKLSDTKFQVDRSFLEKQLGNVDQLATQLRASPKTEDGKVIGFRLSAIRKGSVFDKLGIKNGDVVHTVNGQGLTSMEAAMGAYSTLSSEQAFNFEITRRNQKMTIDYEVR